MSLYFKGSHIICIAFLDVPLNSGVHIDEGFHHVPVSCDNT